MEDNIKIDLKEKGCVCWLG